MVGRVSTLLSSAMCIVAARPNDVAPKPPVSAEDSADGKAARDVFELFIEKNDKKGVLISKSKKLKQRRSDYKQITSRSCAD